MGRGRVTDEEVQGSHPEELMPDGEADVTSDRVPVDMPPVGTPGAILVLAVLADGPMHGYGLAKEIERRRAGYFHTRWGSLYPTLQRLESQGLIAGEWASATRLPADGGREGSGEADGWPMVRVCLKPPQGTWCQGTTGIDCRWNPHLTGSRGGFDVLARRFQWSGIWPNSMRCWKVRPIHHLPLKALMRP